MERIHAWKKSYAQLKNQREISRISISTFAHTAHTTEKSQVLQSNFFLRDGHFFQQFVGNFDPQFFLIILKVSNKNSVLKRTEFSFSKDDNFVRILAR